jgi:hypothetical protein
MSDVVNLLRLRVRDYYNQQSRVQYGIHATTVHTRDLDLTSFFDTLIQEVFFSEPGDVRNAGELTRSEQVLKQIGIDERTAHAFTEEAFAQVVETVGQAMPEVTFQNREGFQFGMSEYDLVVTRPF